MGDIRKKYNLPILLDEADEVVKEMVVKGALRTYVKNFYTFGRPILARMYKIDKGENGQRYMAGIIFDTFAGKTAKEFKDIKSSKYRNLSLINLAFYCNYLQGVFSDLVVYHKDHKDVTINTFEARVTNYGNFMRSLKIKPNIYVDKSMANQTDYKESIDIYRYYDYFNPNKVQDLVNQTIVENIFKNPENFEAPFKIDLEYIKNNNYFDKRKDQYFNYGKYPKEIEKMEMAYQNYLKHHDLTVKSDIIHSQDKNNYINLKDLSIEELIALDEKKDYDEDYVIYDDLEQL